MNGAFYIGALGLDAQQRALDVVANNVANINTTGFKRESVRFSELVSPLREVEDGAEAPADPITGVSGVTISGTPRVWSEGSINVTGQVTDLAINGAGFIDVLGPSGKALLWRGGALQINPEGYLSTPDGTPLRAMISVPQGATNLTISADGTVSAVIDQSSQPRQLGRIDLTLTKAPDTLADQGGGYFEATDPTSLMTVRPGEEGSGVLVQGALESGNVDLSTEMITLLLLQRAYAADAQVVQAGDQLMSIANELRR